MRITNNVSSRLYLLALLVIFSLTGCLPTGSGRILSQASSGSASSGEEGRERQSAGDCKMGQTQQAMLEQINRARSHGRQCGDQFYEAAEPLAWNCKLEVAARAHSNNMAEKGFFGHTGPDGVKLGKRVIEAGYRWSAVAENIAAGQSLVDEVVDGWLSSPGHCANIMKPEVTEMGSARVEAPGSRYSPLWTQVLARPR